jgi:hypothetical protein
MTPQQIDAMKLALEALEAMAEDLGYFTEEVPAITAINEALAEHAMQEVQRLGQEIEQKPVAHCKVRPLRGDESFPKVEIDWVNQPVPGPLFTTPPQRKPLTDEQYFEIGQRHWLSSSKVEQIHKELEEAAHGIKENT